MRKIVAWSLVSLVTAAVGGCGTMENLCGDGYEPPRWKLYGGVQSDLAHAREIYEGVRESDGQAYASCALVRDWSYHSLAYFQTEAGQKLDSALQKIILGPWLLAVDLPLSAVADTLSLPIISSEILTDWDE